MNQQCLTDLFNNRAVHIVVDIQPLYCDPEHPFAKDYKYNYQPSHEAAGRIDGFVKATREMLRPLWVVNGWTYHGLRWGAEPDGFDDPHGFCMKNLYRQNPRPDDETLLKPRMDAFEDTDLERRLCGRNIGTLFVSGVTLSLCVDRTVETARARGFNVCVIDDLVADEDMELPALRAYIDRKGWARVSADKLGAALAKGAPAP